MNIFRYLKKGLLFYWYTGEKKIAIIYVSHREEEALHPDRVFELFPVERGYSGKIRL